MTLTASCLFLIILFISPITCIQFYRRGNLSAGQKFRALWRGYKVASTTRKLHTTKKLLPTTTIPTTKKIYLKKRILLSVQEFHWTPLRKAPDWWNLYETPQPPHRYSSDSVSYDLRDVFKDYRKGSQNPSPKKLKDCTVKVFYDSYGKLRTIKKMDTSYIRALRRYHSLDTNSFYCDSFEDSEYESEYKLSESVRITPKQKRKQTKTTTRKTTTTKPPTTRTTTRPPDRSTTSLNSTKLVDKNKTNKTTKQVTLKWILRKTPIIEAELKYYKEKQIERITPQWGFLRTTEGKGNKTKKKYSKVHKMKTSPIKLIVVRQ
uniref:Uncharacterized protein n=1 Tax=Cacopsylla melanoneura TaxID=428564 RepID=A0A8D8Q8U1_9HEMI